MSSTDNPIYFETKILRKMKFNHQRLYEKLGCLFYAFAAADKNVRRLEEQNLKKQINDIWLPSEDITDQYGTDTAHYIFISFDYLHANDAQAEAAFQDFKDYYNHHSEIMDEPLKMRILKTAEAIAEAFGGINKAELSYMKRLKHLMK